VFVIRKLSPTTEKISPSLHVVRLHNGHPDGHQTATTLDCSPHLSPG